MYGKTLPAFPYGAVYYRRSNPPREDWERDYRTASEDGMNIFRHWFLWSGIELAPGVYDWEAYDRQLDLAAENGMKTMIAEMITIAPEWAYRTYAHARYETREGRKLDAGMHGSCASGGAPGLCLDNDDLREAAGQFLRAMAEHYKGHPGLGGYDVWNECGYRDNVCYCPATAARFRAWLQSKYGDLKTLGEAWHRYSYAEWEDVMPPRHLGGYPDVMDWLQFRIDNAYELMRWRVKLIRSIDADCAITAHGVATSLTRMAYGGTDDWRAAAEVESYGYTWGSSRHGDEPWKQFHAVDLVRASSRGKRYWHAEAYGGPLWMASNVLNKPRDEGRIASPADIRYWDMVSFMCGATGLLYLRWRPLLDGVLFGAFGPYGMDGSRTDRSQMASKVGKWVTAPEQEPLWRSRPVAGEIGILYVPETQIFTYAQQASTDFYAQSMQGAYQGFFDLNVQAEWVHACTAGEHMDEFDVLYLPFPVMLNQATADRLRVWVEKGGTLIAEGCPGYFGDRGHVGPMQPNLGLDELFGVKESYVEFTPDLLGDLEFNFSGLPVRGGIFLQAYEPTTGTPIGWYEDGRVAAVENQYGQGRTRLIGTMAGYGYATHPDDRSPAFFADVIAWAGGTQHVVSSDPRIKARLHTGDGGVYLWVANPVRAPLPVRLQISEKWGPFTTARTLWGAEATVSGRTVKLVAGARDVAVIALGS
jgi:beta-galactosidase